MTRVSLLFPPLFPLPSSPFSCLFFSVALRRHPWCRRYTNVTAIVDLSTRVSLLFSCLFSLPPSPFPFELFSTSLRKQPRCRRHADVTVILDFTSRVSLLFPSQRSLKVSPSPFSVLLCSAHYEKSAGVCATLMSQRSANRRVVPLATCVAEFLTRRHSCRPGRYGAAVVARECWMLSCRLHSNDGGECVSKSRVDG